MSSNVELVVMFSYPLCVKQVFTDIGVVQPLQSAARDGSRLTSRFASEALDQMQQPLPIYQCWSVHQWSPRQVSRYAVGVARVVTYHHATTG